MSIGRPKLSEEIQDLLQYFLWFQLVYAIWQFIRTAKFFRLPYVLVSSLWNGLDSWYKTRNMIIMKDTGALDPIVGDPLAPDHPVGMTIEATDGVNFKVSFDPGDTYMYVTDGQRASHMNMLRTVYLKGAQFARDDDLLWPDGHLIRRLDFVEAMDHVSRGKGYVVEAKLGCFLDCSSKEVLNQNFLRFASIWPLILQARQYDFWSAVLSVIVILL